MYRQKLISNERKINLLQQEETLSEKRRKLDSILDKYPIDLSDFSFNRDEANNYDSELALIPIF